VLLKQCLTESQAQSSPSIKDEESPPALIEAISLFNRHYYWECHEVLEEVWMNEYGPRRLFYQGIIQAAAALYHVLNANPKGVIKLTEDSLSKLQAYKPSYLGVPIENLMESLKNYGQEAKEILGQSREGFDYAKLPYLTIGDDMETPKRLQP
jgi:hypothetical protein